MGLMVSPQVENVLDKINSMLASEGSRLSVVSDDWHSLTVRLERGVLDVECEDCVFDEASVKMLLSDAIRREMPSIENVEVLDA
jgi:Fe-S cluster biogenesis protein NfuA